MPGGRVRQVHGAPVGVAAQPPGGPLVQVFPGQGHVAAVLELEGHRPLLRVERDDLAAAGVGHTQALEGVLAADDLIADGEAAIPDLEPVGPEVAVGVAELLAGGVELVHLVAAVGQDHHAVALLERAPPVGQHRLLELPGGLGGNQPVMLPIGRQCGVDVTLAQVLDRLAFPWLGLPAVLRQRGCAKSQPESPKPSACLDGSELLVIANEHDLTAGVLGVVEQAGELAGAEHPRLVHHQHGP